MKGKSKAANSSTLSSFDDFKLAVEGFKKMRISVSSIRIKKW